MSNVVARSVEGILEKLSSNALKAGVDTALPTGQRTPGSTSTHQIAKKLTLTCQTAKTILATVGIISRSGGPEGGCPTYQH
eukprot:5130583-Amphidinium_carterae.1